MQNRLPREGFFSLGGCKGAVDLTQTPTPWKKRKECLGGPSTEIEGAG